MPKSKTRKKTKTKFQKNSHNISSADEVQNLIIIGTNQFNQGSLPKPTDTNAFPMCDLYNTQSLGYD